MRKGANKMNQKIEIETGALYDLVYTWVRHVGIQQMPSGENTDEKLFIRGAHVFLEKLREVTSKREEDK